MGKGYTTFIGWTVFVCVVSCVATLFVGIVSCVIAVLSVLCVGVTTVLSDSANGSPYRYDSTTAEWVGAMPAGRNSMTVPETVMACSYLGANLKTQLTKLCSWRYTCSIVTLISACAPVSLASSTNAA